MPGSVQKVYYTENVYRTGSGYRGFREIMQAGEECIGEVDDYMISEVLTLACRSLRYRQLVNMNGSEVQIGAEHA